MGVEVETLLSSEALEATGETVLEPGAVEEAAAQIWEVLKVRLGREEEAGDRGEEQGGKAAFICRMIAIKEVEENLAATAAQAATVAQAVTEEMEEMEDMEETEVLEELSHEAERVQHGGRADDVSIATGARKNVFPLACYAVKGTEDGKRLL